MLLACFAPWHRHITKRKTNCEKRKFLGVLRRSAVAALLALSAMTTGATSPVMAGEGAQLPFDNLATQSQQVLVGGGLLEPTAPGFFCFTGCLTQNDCSDGCHVPCPQTGRDLERRMRATVLAGVAALAASHAFAGSAERPQAETDHVEEVVVTAERLVKGDRPTGTIITQTYNVRQRGMSLYDERRYKEALPLLLIAAERGFKWPQAMAGDIYLHGRGDVQRDLQAGVGWLGVAAAPRTAPLIDTYFRQVMAALPCDVRASAEATVRGYRAPWGSRGWRVSCRRVISDAPNAVATSLRLGRRLRCNYIDEVPVCRQSYLDPMFGPPIGGVQLPWECDPVNRANVDP